jgi:hypothetical protein
MYFRHAEADWGQEVNRRPLILLGKIRNIITIGDKQAP